MSLINVNIQKMWAPDSFDPNGGSGLVVETSRSEKEIEQFAKNVISLIHDGFIKKMMASPRFKVKTKKYFTSLYAPKVGYIDLHDWDKDGSFDSITVWRYQKGLSENLAVLSSKVAYFEQYDTVPDHVERAISSAIDSVAKGYAEAGRLFQKNK